MANLKISEMQSVGSCKPTDLMYIIQDGISSHITISNLFGKLPDMLLSGSLQLDTLESIVANGGNISDSHVVTALTVDNMDREFFLSSGTVDSPLPNFMLKIVYLKTQYSGKAIIKGGFVSGINSVSLINNGDAGIFLSTPSGWIYLGGTGMLSRVGAITPPGFPSGPPIVS